MKMVRPSTAVSFLYLIERRETPLGSLPEVGDTAPRAVLRGLDGEAQFEFELPPVICLVLARLAQ